MDYDQMGTWLQLGSGPYIYIYQDKDQKDKDSHMFYNQMGTWLQLGSGPLWLDLPTSTYSNVTYLLAISFTPGP
jgi:hypothetical protein